MYMYPSVFLFFFSKMLITLLEPVDIKWMIYKNSFVCATEKLLEVPSVN